MVGLIVGLATNIYELGVKGIKLWGTGVITPLLLLFVLYAFRMIGAGDVKLFIVIGGFIGNALVIQSIFIAFIIGAIMSVFKLIKYKNFSYRMKYLVNYLSKTIQSNKYQPYCDLKKTEHQSVIPFTVAITGGVIIVILKEYYCTHFI